MPLGQQQPVIPRVLDQPTAGLHQPVLQARQRPTLDPVRQSEPPPQVAQVVGQHAQLQSHFVGPEAMTRQPRPVRGLFAFFDRSRVGNWRGGSSGRSLGRIRGFPLRARLASSVAPFPAPATSHAACGFPALRAPAHCAARFMGPIRLESLSRTVLEPSPKFRCPLRPSTTPPLPSEALA